MVWKPLGERNVFGISPKPSLCLLGYVFVFSPPDDDKSAES